jgi:phosphatidylethanolamine/phosphatidyl-N-methylethanolamine N-methyltransferase
MRPDPSYEQYIQQWTEIYQNQNYDTGISGFFLKKSHEWSENDFDATSHFGKVLEVGSGTGIHINFVKHSFDEYWMTDLSDMFIDKIGITKKKCPSGKVILAKEDASRLSFPDSTFDRLIAAHVLEHLYYPHVALREWVRVLKPGGILSIVLPCDPGVMWRLGRYAVARKKFISAGLDYDYWMAREHVNPINCLVSFLRYYFQDVKEKWLPFRVPSMDANLFYIVHIKV